MLAFVVNMHVQPLMPCKPAKARHLVEQGKAKVINCDPYTIKLIHGSSGYKQPIIAGMDTGSKFIGISAIGNNKTLYQAQVAIRDDITTGMKKRASYRGTRRGRKTRYRQPRFDNRGKKGFLPPSIVSKINSHHRERKALEKILPVTTWVLELASFDIHAITNPDVSGKGYQEGGMKGFY